MNEQRNAGKNIECRISFFLPELFLKKARNQESTLTLKTSIQCHRMSLALTLTLNGKKDVFSLSIVTIGIAFIS